VIKPQERDAILENRNQSDPMAFPTTFYTPPAIYDGQIFCTKCETRHPAMALCNMPCATCDGKGEIPLFTGLSDCPDCNGH